MAKKPPPKPAANGIPTALPDPDTLLFPKIAHCKKRAMLTAFSMCGQLVKSATTAHIDVRYHHRWLEDDPDYAEAWQRANRYAADIIEDRVIHLGMEGYEEAVWYQGVQVGTQRKYLQTLLLAAVNAALPDKYKHRSSTEYTISPQLLALRAQWQHARDESTSRQAPRLPAYDDEDAEDVPEAEIAPPPLRFRPQGQPSRAAFFAMLDRVNGHPRENEEEQ